MTKINWTDITWNPGIYGCTEVSPACANCYAAKMAHRLVAMRKYPSGITEKRASGIHWSGQVVAEKPNFVAVSARKLPKKVHKRVFVTSMADLFHEDVPFKFVDAVFVEMVKRPHLTFQVLTKRPARALDWWLDLCSRAGDGPTMSGGSRSTQWPDNVWIGCTVEDQLRANERIPHLLQLPAKVRFLSCEPLLSHVNLGTYIAGIHWVIAGGESGLRSRPTHPLWFRSIRSQYKKAEIPFFFKQWGYWVGDEDAERAGRPGYYEQCREDGAVPSYTWRGRLSAPTLQHIERFKDVRYPSWLFGPSHTAETLDGAMHREFPNV